MYNFYNFSDMFKPDEVIDYLRKSRSDDPTLTVEEVLSKHETILDEWAERNLGAPVPEENKYREVVSGETIADRPEIQKILRRIESPKIKAIKVVEVQRLSRGDLEDAGRLIKLLRYTNTYVITPQKTYDIRDEYDRDAFERELKRGNEYLEYTKKIMNNGRLLSVSQGNFIGSIPPYGYDKGWIMEGKRKCPTLVENKEQADIVRLIFDLYVNHDYGCKRICNHLDSLGVKPPRGVHWSAPALKDMLINVHYIGKVKWNWRKTVRVVEESEIKKTRPKSKDGEFLIYDGRHEAIISEELFCAAQKKKALSHRAKATTKIRNPFAGLLFCQCGKAMIMQNSGQTFSARLTCGDQTFCNSGSCRFEEILDAVCEILKQNIENFEAKKKNEEAEDTSLQEGLISSLKKRLHELEKTELAQWEAHANPNDELRMPTEIFKKLNEKVRKEIELVQQSLRDAYETISTPVNYDEIIIKFKDALYALQNPSVSASEKNKLLKACIKRITYTRKRPQLLKRAPEERKGTRLSTGANWSNPPIKLDVKLNI